MMLVRTRWRQILRGFASRKDGAAAIEYAVLIGVVITCLAVGAYCLGQLSEAVASTTAIAMGSTGQGGSNASPFGKSGSPLDSSELAEAPQVAPRRHFIALGIALFVACASPLSFVVLKTIFKKPTKDSEAAGEAEPVKEEPPSHDDLAFAKRREIRNIFENNMASLLSGHLKARHIMSRQLTCVRKTAAIAEVLELMELKRVRHVMVSDANEQLLGIISSQDCAQREGKRAVDIMTAEPYSLDADSDFAPAVTMLVRRRISCLPVTSDGKLIGVLTTTDFLMALQCALHTLSNVAEHVSDHKARAEKVFRRPSAAPPVASVPTAEPALV